ncbi:MAG: serine/threonine protein kinase, partial [Cyanobacteria bacterium]|nr:serine/threonine protein kinase [Cyanobacteriota bacterium]
MVEQESWKSPSKTGAGLATGDFAFDKFEIMKSLGRGGMGTVYKAKDTVLDRIVALKVMKVQSMNEKDFLRFQNESRLACRLHHPNIAAIYDLGVSKNGQLFMSMEFIQGTTVERLLRENGKLPVLDALEIAFQVSQALAAAHDGGIIHRDVKPANIMILDGVGDDKGKVKLLDFGIATRVDDGSSRLALTAPGNLIGSPSYMSPEQCSALPVIPESDVYSLGCVLFECLVGRPPYLGESLMETLIQHQSAALPDLSQLLGSDLPEELSILVRKMLAKAPQDRCNAQQACDLIESLIVDLQIGKHKNAEKEDIEKSTRAYKSEKRLAVGLMALTAIVGCALFYFVNGEPRGRKALQKRPMELYDEVVEQHGKKAKLNTEFIFYREKGEDVTVEQLLAKNASELNLDAHGITDNELAKLENR